jgi:Flp pilus assembly protein TadG
MGIMEFGRAYNMQTTLSQAAREGVRVMALQGTVATARAATRAAAPAYTFSDAQIVVTPSTCSGNPTTNATVTLTYPMSYLTGFFGSSITLTGKGVMRCNG